MYLAEVLKMTMMRVRLVSTGSEDEELYTRPVYWGWLVVLWS